MGAVPLPHPHLAPTFPAQSLAFLSVSLALACVGTPQGSLEVAGVLALAGLPLSPHLQGALGPAAAVCAVAAALLLATARVRSGLHTLPQVVVGFLFGGAAAVGWWRAGHLVVSHAALDAVMDGPLRAWKAAGVAVAVVGGLSVRWNAGLDRRRGGPRKGARAH